MLGERHRRWSSAETAPGRRSAPVSPCYTNSTSYRPLQIRDIEPMLGQCLADVVDGGPTLNQLWFNVSCFLGGYSHCIMVMYDAPLPFKAFKRLLLHALFKVSHIVIDIF